MTTKAEQLYQCEKVGECSDCDVPAGEPHKCPVIGGAVWKCYKLGGDIKVRCIPVDQTGA